MSDQQGVSVQRVPARGIARSPHSRSGTIVLGALTLWPSVGFVLYLVLIFASFGFALAGSRWAYSLVPTSQVVFPLYLLTMLDMFGLTGYYAVNVYREPALVGDRKLLWMLIVLLGGVIGQAIYYILWILKGNTGVLGSSCVAQPPAQPSAQQLPRV